MSSITCFLAHRSASHPMPRRPMRLAASTSEATRRSEPAGEQDLVRQRSAEDVADRVEQIEEVETGERVNRSEADQRDAGHKDAGDHQTARAESVDDPSGGEAECRADDELAE